MPKNRLTPSLLAPLLDHLVHYGELSAQEAKILKAADAIAFLEAGDYLFRHGESWGVTEQFLGLLPVASLTELTRKIFFGYPGYHRYLTAVVAAEITRRGLEGAMTRVESWILNDLPHLAGELNTLLDEIQCRLTPIKRINAENNLEEDQKPAFSKVEFVELKECSPGEIARAFRQYIDELQANEEMDFEAWNKELLGVSGNQETLFEAMIARKALGFQRSAISSSYTGNGNPPSDREGLRDGKGPSEAPFPGRIAEDLPEYRASWSQKPIDSLDDELFACYRRPVFMPPPETYEDRAVLEKSTGPTIEHYVFGRVHPFVPLSAQNRSPSAHYVLLRSHPIPWIMVQMAIANYLGQSAGSGERLILRMDHQDHHHESDAFRVEVVLDDVGCGDLVQLLPGLLEMLGFNPIMPFGNWADTDIAPLYQLLLEAGVLEMERQRLVLSEAFRSRLFERPFINELIRNPQVKKARSMILARLGDMVSQQQDGNPR